MWVLEARQRRGILRRELLRRCRGSLAVASIPLLVGLVFFAVGLRDDRGQPIALDAYLTPWLGVVMAALVLALTRRRPALHRMLRRLPTAAADELRVGLEVGLGCGCLVLASWFLVEVLFQPTLTKPTFKSQLNPLETETLQNLPGVPLLRFSIDGRESRGLVHERALRSLQGRGIEALGSRLWKYMDHPDLTGPFPQPGQMLFRFDRDNWKELDEYDRHDLIDLGLSEGSEVEVTLERYVSDSEYLSRTWRREGLLRDRAWPLLDRSVAFLFLLAMLIALTTVWSSVRHPTPQHYSIATQYLAVGALYVGFNDTKLWCQWIRFSDADPNGDVHIPVLAVLHNPLEHLVFPAAVAGFSLLSCRWSYQTLRSMYGEIDAGQVKAEPIGWLFMIICFTIAISSLGSLLTPSEPSTVGPQLNDLSASKAVKTVLAGVWVVAMVYIVTTPIRLAQRWVRRDPLLSRLPVQPRDVALKRLRLFAAYEALLLVIPLMLELLVSWAWVAFGGSAGRLDVAVVTGQADAIGSTAFGMLLVLALAVVILVLMLYSRALARAAIVVAAGSLLLGPSLIVYRWSSVPILPVLIAISVVGFVAAFRQIKRNISWGRLAVLPSAT